MTTPSTGSSQGKLAERGKPERIRIGTAVAILWVSASKVRKMVRQGKIPGAGWIDGCLTFDEIKLRALVIKAETEAKPCAKPHITASDGAIPRGGASKSRATTLSGRFAPAIRKLLQAASRPTSGNGRSRRSTTATAEKPARKS
jgi:hypothetical protein